MSELPAEQASKDPEKYVSAQESYWQSSTLWLAALATAALIALLISAGLPEAWRKWVEYMTIHILAVLTFIFLIANTINARKQWQITYNQELEATRTRLLVKGQLDAMTDALRRTDNLLAQNERMITASQKQADAAAVALIQNKNFFEMAERPRIGIETVGVENIQAYRNLWVNIKWRNSGKSSAQVLHSVGVVFTYKSDGLPDDCCPPMPSGQMVEGMVSRPVIPPNSSYAQGFGLDAFLDREYVKNIEDGNIIVFVLAQVLYRGFAPDPYVSQYYARYYPEFEGFGECSEGNLFT